MRIHGKWYFPDLNHKHYFGTLDSNEQNIFQLNVLANDLPKQKETVIFPVVYGETPEGNFTLLNVLWNGNYKINHQSKIVQSKLRCSSLIREYCFKHFKELKFDNFRFNFDGLREWVGIPELDKSLNYSEIKASYKNPKSQQFKVQKYLKLVFEFEMDSDTPKNDTIFQINQSTYLNLVFSRKKRLEFLIKYKNKIIHLFELLMNYPVEPYIQRLYSNTILNPGNKLFTSKKELIYFENNKSKINEFPFDHIFPIRLKDLNNFELITQQWFKKYDRLKPIINIFRYQLKEKLNIENKLVLICQALETYHNRFRESSEKYKKNEKNNLGPHFKVRIEKLLKFYSKNISKKTFSNYDIKIFPEKVMNTRHYLTHYSKNREKKKWNDSQMYSNVPRLIFLLHQLILKEIGVSCELLNDYANKRYFGKYYTVKKYQQDK